MALSVLAAGEDYGSKLGQQNLTHVHIPSLNFPFIAVVPEK
jgi:hypothetical protein